jgi:hypothetical protein
MLTGIAFASQGSFVGMPYNRICFDKPEVTDWVFRGMEGNILGDFGFSGDGAAGYELDRIDPADFKIKDGEIVILAQAHTNMDKRFILVPEDGTQRSLTFLIVSITHVLLFFPKIKIYNSSHTVDQPSKDFQRRCNEGRHDLFSSSAEWGTSVLGRFHYLLWKPAIQQLQ